MKEFWNNKAQTPGDITPGQGPCASAVDDMLRNISSEELAVSSLLDLGCGEGRLTGLIAGRVASYTGADISSVALARARAYATERGLTNVNLIELVDGDKGKLGNIGPFDIVTSYTVFMHLPQSIFAEYLNSIFKVLKPKGHFNFQIAGPDEHLRYDNIGDWNFWTSRYYPDEVVAEHLTKAGFVIVEAPLQKVGSCWLTIKGD